MYEEKRILGYLIEKYNKSKKFNGQNKLNTKISVKVGSLFPQYNDDSNYSFFDKLNDIIDENVDRKYIFAENKNNVYNLLVLNEEKIDSICEYIGVKSKKEELEELREVIKHFELKDDDCLSNYCKEQFHKIENNKNVDYYFGDINEYSSFLDAVYKIRQNNDEIYFRDFSVSRLSDSKKLESIQSQVRSFLVKWCDASDASSAIEDYNIVKNPTSITIKGSCILKFKNNLIDVSDFIGGFTISSLDIKSIKEIVVKTDNIITIENLTTFNSFYDNKFVSIFLSGFHNTAKRDFLRLLYEKNRGGEYYHYGDIDAGGFYILLDLIKKTNIPFMAYKMDIDTLEKYRNSWKTLTQNDKTRLNQLLNSEYKQTVEYMLKNNCKLEQEIMDTIKG